MKAPYLSRTRHLLLPWSTVCRAIRFHTTRHVNLFLMMGAPCSTNLSKRWMPQRLTAPCRRVIVTIMMSLRVLPRDTPHLLALRSRQGLARPTPTMTPIRVRAAAFLTLKEKAMRLARRMPKPTLQCRSTALLPMMKAPRILSRRHGFLLRALAMCTA